MIHNDLMGEKIGANLVTKVYGKYYVVWIETAFLTFSPTAAAFSQPSSVVSLPDRHRVTSSSFRISDLQRKSTARIVTGKDRYG